MKLETKFLSYEKKLARRQPMLLPLSTFNVDVVSIPNTNVAAEILRFYASLFNFLKRQSEVTLSDLGKDPVVAQIVRKRGLGELVALTRVLQATRAFDVDLKRWRRDSICVRSRGLFDIFPRYEGGSDLSYEQYACSILWGLFLRRGSIVRSMLERAFTDKPEEEVPIPALPRDPTLYEMVIAHVYQETVRSWPKSVGSSVGATTIINRFKVRTDAGILLALMSICGMVVLDSSGVRSIARPASLEDYTYGFRKYLRKALGSYVGLSKFLELLERRADVSELRGFMPAWQRAAYEVLIG